VILHPKCLCSLSDSEEKASEMWVCRSGKFYSNYTEHLGQKFDVDNELRLGVHNWLHGQAMILYASNISTMLRWWQNMYQCRGTISRNGLIVWWFWHNAVFVKKKLEVWVNSGPSS
jgi:hypothetical protein